jgi:hypothetical protein
MVSPVVAEIAPQENKGPTQLFVPGLLIGGVSSVFFCGKKRFSSVSFVANEWLSAPPVRR